MVGGETRMRPDGRSMVGGSGPVSVRAVRPKGYPRVLRRQWRMALGVMIVALSLALTGTSLAYLRVISYYGTAARHLDSVVSLSSEVQKSVADHEGLAHLLWNGSPVDRSLYLRQQVRIERQFALGKAELTHSNEAGLLARASGLWRGVLQSRGLWAPGAQAKPGVTLANQQLFGAASDRVTVTLSELSTVGIADSTREIAHADVLQSGVMWLLVGLFAIVASLAVYVARRLTIDVLRPIELLQRATARLRDGKLEEQVPVAGVRRPNELSELAETFNSMASALQASHASLSHQATHDSLTGLSNRAAFEQLLQGHVATGAGSGREQIGVLFIDLDDFKRVNDSLGHSAGDELLVAVAGRLTSCVRSSDRVARLGGDEFAILVVDPVSEPSSAIDIAERVLEDLASPFLITGKRVSVGTSIGISLRLPELGTAESILARADVAMYTAKAQGKQRWVISDPSLEPSLP